MNMSIEDSKVEFTDTFTQLERGWLTLAAKKYLARKTDRTNTSREDYRFQLRFLKMLLFGAETHTHKIKIYCYILERLFVYLRYKITRTL